MHVVATAGHVDHGKSSLVRALTGTDPDRLEEERRRGLTIDLGFAAFALPSGAAIAFVDVPGHVRFIKNMLAGVGAVDACLFVVAATEGWKPQSEEHLRILELLGIGHGLVALTKADLLGDDEAVLELARLEVAEHLEGTFLAGAEIVPLDSLSRRGLPELVAGLERLVATTPQATDRGRPRLWVDRAFAAKGSGTVVTGTLTGGALAVGESVALVPGTRGRSDGAVLRIRALESHGERVERAAPGRRLAVNLAGVSHHEVRRGQAVVHPQHWAPTATLDATLTVLATLDHDVARRGAYHAFIGTGAYPVRLRVLGGERIEAGGEGFVRLRLPVALPLLPGDRYVLREVGRSETVGGGEVLDVAPVLPASRARPDRTVARVVAERGFVEAALLERLTGQRVEATLAGRWVADPQALSAARERLVSAVAAAGPYGLDVAVLSAIDRAVLETVGEVTVSTGRARDDGGGDEASKPALVRALEERLFAPPSPEELGAERAEVAALVRSGEVVRLEAGIVVAAAAIPAAAARLAALLEQEPGGITASAAREALGTSRKFALPLLAQLDALGATRRRGDLRIAGPRLAELAATAGEASRAQAPA